MKLMFWSATSVKLLATSNILTLLHFFSHGTYTRLRPQRIGMSSNVPGRPGSSVSQSLSSAGCLFAAHSAHDRSGRPGLVVIVSAYSSVVGADDNGMHYSIQTFILIEIN